MKKFFKTSYMYRCGRVLFSAAAALLFFCSCSHSQKHFSGSFIGPFDTVTNMVIYCESKAEFEQYLSFSKDFLQQYHQLYDIYNSYDVSNLKTVNENAGVKAVKVDKRITDLLIFCKQAYEKTNKTVNFAMGSVLQIWHRYRQNGIDDPQNAALPEISLLKEAFKHTDPANIQIDIQNSTVYISDKALRLDVGAVAKGYATDMLCEALIKKGVKSAIISVGGNVKSIGNKPNGEDWSVDIQSPFEQDEIILTHKIKKDTAVTSSGDYERYYTVNGVKYCHIINPQTLYPSRNFRAVTVISQSALEGDYLSTALFNLSIDEGKALLKKYENIQAIWILPDGQLIKSY